MSGRSYRLVGGVCLSLSLSLHTCPVCAWGELTNGGASAGAGVARSRHRNLVPAHTRARLCRRFPGDDAGEMEKLSASISDLSWSAVSLPLDAVVGKFRLPTLVKLSAGRQTCS